MLPPQDDPLAVRAESRGYEISALSEECGQRGPGVGIPDPGGSVTGTREHFLAIPAKLRGPDNTIV